MTLLIRAETRYEQVEFEVVLLNGYVAKVKAYRADVDEGGTLIMKDANLQMIRCFGPGTWAEVVKS